MAAGKPWMCQFCCVFFFLSKRLKQKLSSNSKNSFFFLLLLIFFFAFIFLLLYSGENERRRGGHFAGWSFFFRMCIYRIHHISEFQTEIRGIRIPKRSLFRAKISLFLPLLRRSTCCCFCYGCKAFFFANSLERLFKKNKIYCIEEEERTNEWGRRERRNSKYSSQKFDSIRSFQSTCINEYISSSFSFLLASVDLVL